VVAVSLNKKLVEVVGVTFKPKYPAKFGAGSSPVDDRQLRELHLKLQK
jgi:hypothetical protein